MNTRGNIKPIFVLGKHRSGTSWVTNILLSHPNIFTPQHEAHQGQHESAFFSSVMPYFNWGWTEQDRIALKATFEVSDFYKLAIDPSLVNFDQLDSLSDSPPEFFRKVMNTAARARACTHWVEKSPAHTLYIKEIYKYYPDAKFIAVSRDIIDTVISTVYRSSNSNSLLIWVKNSMRAVTYYKILSRHKSKIYWIKYEELKNNYNNTIKDLFEYLDLEVDKNEIKSNYAPNTTFIKNKPFIKYRYRLCVKIISLVSFIIPCKIFELLIDSYKQKKKASLPSWFFRIHKGVPNSRSINSSAANKPIHDE